MNSEKSRNIILAIVLSVLVLIGWQYFFAAPQLQKDRLAQQQAQTQTQPQTNAAPGVAQPPVAGAPAQAQPKTRAEALAASPRVAIDTPSLSGSIDLTGGIIDDVVLKTYRETIDPQSPNIALLSPAGGPSPYWAGTGFDSDAPVKTPNRRTVWSADSTTLTTAKPVTLTWDNDAGLKFKRVIAVDDKYMFTVRDSVENGGAGPVSLRPYALILRRGKPDVAGYAVLHEGFVGVIGDGSVQEITYANIDKEAGRVRELNGDGGWLGFTDRYWGTAVIPDQTEPIEARFSANGTVQPEDYLAGYVGPTIVVAPGATGEAIARVFAGAKEVATIDAYAKNLGIKKFDLMIDWGWFYFITKPLFWVIDLIYHHVGNYGFAIIVLAVIVKVIFAPFANQSYRAMVNMQRLEPEIEAIRDASTEPELTNSEIIELYKRNKVTAPSGCLPMIIQLVVFFAIYKIMFVTLEMRQLPFIGWIQDISVRDPTNIISLCGLLNWEPESLPLFGHFLHVGIMPAILGLTLWIIQLRINTSLLGSFQKFAFAILPIATMFFVRNMKSAEVIFFVTYNVLSIAHFIILAGVNKQSVGNIKQYTATFLPYGKIQPIVFLMMLAPILQNIFVLLVFWRRTPTPKTKDSGPERTIQETVEAQKESVAPRSVAPRDASVKRWKLALTLAVVAAVTVPTFAGTWRLAPGKWVDLTEIEKLRISNEIERTNNCTAPTGEAEDQSTDPSAKFDEAVALAVCEVSRDELRNGGHWEPPERVTPKYVMFNLFTVVSSFILTFALVMTGPSIGRRYLAWLRS